MVRDRRTWSALLAKARERLLETGSVDLAAGGTGEGPRADILRSWRRSLDDGANASALESPYDENVNLSSRLVRAAEPVITRVHQDVLGGPISVVLADSKGKILIRRTGEPALEGRLDAALLAPGFSYAERYVGTNGIGTALEGRSAASVRGAEHFNDVLQVFACVGVPVRDPVTRRQLGVLDITTWADHANPALTALVRQAAQVIEEGLLELSSRGTRAVLDEYLVASRNREDQVLAVAEDALIGTTAAEQRLGGLARDELWALVGDALGGRDQAELPLLTRTGETLQLRLRAIRRGAGHLVGALLEYVDVRPPATVPARSSRSASPELAAFAGLSPVVMGPALTVARLASARGPVCLLGEPGVGKKAIVEAAVARHLPGRMLTVLDGVDTDPEVLEKEATGILADGHPVLLRSADTLPTGVAAGLAAVGGNDTGGWLVLAGPAPAAGAQPTPLQVELTAAGVPMVVVPPLRARVQDLRGIVPRMLDRITGGRVAEVTPELMNRLMREPWPGNLAEVERLLHRMAAGATERMLGVEDLPREFGSGVRRTLSPMEWMAREAIVEALRSCGGDKTLAAESLGISRASIYRKIKAFGIDPRDL